MKALLPFLVLLSLLMSNCCTNTTQPAVETRPGAIPILSTLTATESMVAPVMRLIAIECPRTQEPVEGESADNEEIYSGSVTFVADASERFGTDVHPNAYVFLTAEHVLEETTTIHHSMGPFIMEAREVSVSWKIEVHSYDYKGDVVDTRWIDLCDDPDVSFVTYRSNKLDFAVLLVFTAEPISVQPAVAAPPEVADDLAIGSKVYMVGCQGSTWPWLRDGLMSRRINMGYYVASCVADFGDSGGAIYDEYGRVVGIVITKPVAGAGVGFIPVSRIYDELLANDMFPLLMEIWR